MSGMEDGSGSDPVAGTEVVGEAEDFLMRSRDVIEVERGLKGVLHGSHAIRAHMLAGDLAAGLDGMNALAEFIDSLPPAYTAQILFMLANQVLHGDAFTRKGSDDVDDSGH